MAPSVSHLLARVLASVMMGFASVASASPALPSTPAIDSFLHFVKTLDLADPKIGLEPKQGEGTSPYFKLKVDGKTWGAILPGTSGTSVFGEIFSFQLARALGRPELSGPGALCVLRGPARERFRKAMEEASFANPLREKSRVALLEWMAQHPDSLETAVKIWGPKPYDYDSIGMADDKLNEDDPMAKFLQASNPQPTTRMITLPGVPGPARECDLARQLSTIFLIDALASQQDRFSKGNLNVIVQNGVASFVAYDNGGTWGDAADLQMYLHGVTRFDREVADRILTLDGFLNAKQPEFLGFTKELDLQTAMSMETQAPSWQQFKKHLAEVAQHIRAQKGDCYF